MESVRAGKKLENGNSNYSTTWTFNRLLLVAFLIRLILVLYARIHDHLFGLSFTDVDYRVFSDAANLTWEGKSPYDRTTYRYTPLIAWILVPNVVFADFGIFVFYFLPV